MSLLLTLLAIIPGLLASQLPSHDDVGLTWLHESDEALLVRLRRQMSTMTQHLNIPNMQGDRGEDHTMWHSFQLGHGTHSRDALRVSQLQHLDEFSGAEFNVSRWLTHHKTKNVALGLTSSSLIFCRFHRNNSNCFPTELSGTPTAATIFSMRNLTSLRLDVIIVCAVNNNFGTTLQWFVSKNEALTLLSNPWPLLHSSIELHVFHMSGQYKLVALNAVQPPRTTNTADVYDFQIEPGVDLWLSHKIQLNSGTSVAISYVGNIAYLAIAQGQKEVLIFEFKDKKINLINRVPSPGVKSIITFEISSMSFLAISGSAPRVLKMPPRDWDSTDVLHFTNDSSVLRWLAVPVATYRNEVLLLAETEANKVEIVMWTSPAYFAVDGNKSPNCIGSDMSSIAESSRCLSSLEGVAGLIVEDFAAFLIPKKTRSARNADNEVPGIVLAITHLEHINCPAQLERLTVIKKRNIIQGLLDAQDAVIEEAKTRFEHSVKDNSVVTAPWTIGHVSAGSIEVSEEYSVDKLEFADHKWSGEDWDYLKPALQKTKDKIQQRREQINSLQDRLSGALLEGDNGDVEIQGHKFLHGSLIVQGNTYIKSAEFENLNNIPVSNLFEDTVRLDRMKMIRGHKTVSNIHVQKLYITDSLNDENILPFADKNKPINIHGDVHFKNHVVINNFLEVTDTENNLRSANQDEVEYFHYPHLDVESVQVSGYINNHPISLMETQFSAEVASKKLHIPGTLKVAGNVDVRTINGMDLKELIDRTVPIYATQPIHIPGYTSVTSCHMQDVDVSIVNNLVFPDDYVLQGAAADIWGYKNFVSMDVDTLEASSVNSVPLEELVTLDTPQNLSGQWIMEDLTVLGNLQTSSVFEHDLPQTLDSETQALSAHAGVVFKNLNVAGNVVASHSSWEHYLADVVYKDDIVPVITGAKQFLGEVKTEILYLNAPLNDVNVSNFITLNTKQYIPGNKLLTGEVHFDNLDVNGHILDVDLNSLITNAVRISSNQTGVTELHFTRPVIVKRGLDTKNLNSLHDGSSFVTLDADQTIKGPLSFERIDVGTLVVEGDVNTTSVINGLDFLSLESSRVSLSQDQLIVGEWSMSQATVANNFDVTHVNNVNYHNLAAESVISMLPNLESLSFKELFVTGNIKTSFINHYNLSAIASDVIWVNSENVILSKLTLLGEVKCDALIVTEKLNNDIVHDIVTDIVQKHEEDVTFTGHKTFHNGAYFKDVETNFVNGKRMSDMLTIHSDQEIISPIKFVDSVEIMGYSEVKNLNELSINEWQRKYCFENNWHVIKGNLTFNDSFVATNLEVVHTVAGRDVESYFPSLVWLHDDVILRSTKLFANDVLMKNNLMVSKTINGIDLSELMKEIVLIDRPNWIRTPVTFMEDIFIDSQLEVVNDLHLQWLNSVYLKEWVESAVYLDQQTPIFGSMHFESISSDGPINTKQLNKMPIDRFILLHQSQIIPEVLTFTRVSTGSDVSVGNFVNGLRIDKEFENTLLMEGDQVVRAAKIFDGKVKVRRDLITYGPVNGYQVKDVVTLNTDQTIYGPKVFDYMSLKEEMFVQGLVSGQDLSVWRDRAVFKDSPHGVVTGHWHVKGNVSFMGSVMGNESTLLDNVHLPSLIAAHEARTEQANQDKANMRKNKNIYCQNIHQMLETARKQTYIFEYLEAKQYLPTAHPIESYIHFKLGAEDMITVSLKNSCEGMILRWDPDHAVFLPVMKTSLGGITSWAVLPTLQNGDAILVSAGGNSECQHTGGNLWLVRNTQSLQLLHVQNLGVWTYVENHPSSLNAIYAKDIENHLSEWMYHNGELVKTKDLGLALSVEHLIDPRNSGVSKSLGESVPIGPDFHSFFLPSRKLDGNHSVNTEKLQTRSNNSEPIVMQSRVAGPNFTVTTNRHLAKVQGKHDDIRIFEGDLKNKKLFHKLPATNPGLIQSINFGPSRETFMIFLEDNTELQLYKYQGMAGFTMAVSAKFPGAQLLGIESLPTRNLLTPRAFILLATPDPNHGLFVLEMRMLGDPVANIVLPDACRTN